MPDNLFKILVLKAIPTALKIWGSHSFNELSACRRVFEHPLVGRVLDHGKTLA